MNKKSLILSILLILMVFLSASTVCAEDSIQIDDTIDATQGTEVTVKTTDTNDEIQEKINSLQDGDTLTFEKGDYNNILLYVNQTSITINGNGATLHGYDNLVSGDTRIPDIILNKTTEGGYAISNPATLYILNTNNLVLKDINIVAGANSGTDKGADTARYNNCLVYNYQSTNTQIINSTFDGSTWGIYYFQSTGGLIEGNIVKNQGVTGIFNFQTPNTIIRNNTVINAKNHGIDVRHMVGPNVKILNNKIVGAKEGIYLLHSGKHTVTGNTIINCSLSSITCCGANNVLINNNTLQNSRIGVLLSGSTPVGGSYVGYTNITIGNNQWKLDTLPFPPTFTCYVAEAKSDYATVNTMMGTHSDSLYGDTYTEYKGIEEPAPIIIDYDNILRPTNTTKTITSGMTSAEIQETINSMNDGDTLIFEENAVFENVCIYIDKNIKVIGNNATLKGVNNVSYDYVPEIVTNRTSAGGYAIPNIAVLYVLNTTNAVISNLNIVANYPKYTMPCQPGTENYNAYYTTGIYGGLSKNLVITGCTITGASWGIFLGGRPDGDYKYGCQNVIITKNIVKNQYTTGIMNFASPNSIIAENTVINAVNHGIDVRFQAGFGAKVFNNTISGSKEGIYLLHSYGHYVYNNTISNCKISSITCYGSHDEYIFNNTLSKSRVAILLGGSSDNSYYNVTIGPNIFDGDKLPFPPTFAFTLAKSENQYQTASHVIGTYSDKLLLHIIADDVETEPYTGQLNLTLIDQNDKPVNNAKVTVTIGDAIYEVKTNTEGSATIDLNLTKGDYTAVINFAGNDHYAKAATNTSIAVGQPKSKINISVSDINVNYKDATGELIANLTDSITGEPISNVSINVNLNGANITKKSDSKGQVKVSTASLSPGEHIATFSYPGDSEYKPSSAAAIVTVNKADTEISASNVSIAYKNSTGELVATITNEYGKPLSVNLNVNFNGANSTLKADSKGKISMPIGVLAPGNYVATISYKGNVNYNPSSTTANVLVNKADTIISAPDVTVTYMDSNGKLVATLKNIYGNSLGVNVNVNINGENYTVKANSKGQITIPTGNLSVGTHVATISYKGNVNYNPSNATANIVVKKASSVISALNISVLYKDPTEQIVATLTDAYGNTINDNVTVNINGKTYTVKTDTAGKIRISTVSLYPGSYVAAISYNGNANYKSSSATANVLVNKADTIISAPDVSVTYKNTTGELVATLTNAYGKPLSVNVNVNLNGVNYTIKANSDGKISVPTAGLAPGSYIATISYKGNVNYNPSSTTANVLVNKADTIISAPDVTVTYKNTTGELVATLTNAYGKPLSVNVNVNLNGVNYTVKADSKGQISIPIASLAPGNYTATITYKGNVNYNPTTTTANVLVNKADTIISAQDVTVKCGDENGKLVATIKNAYGGSLGVNVNVNLNGHDYLIKADSKGKIIIPTASLAPGNYTATISYNGNVNYNPSNTTATITVNS